MPSSWEIRAWPAAGFNNGVTAWAGRGSRGGSDRFPPDNLRR